MGKLSIPREQIAEQIYHSEERRAVKEFLIENFGTDEKLRILDKLTYLYFDVNSVINISAIRDVGNVYIKHYLDSIQPYKHFSGSCCDVGCGGGFPCLPLAIATGLKFLGIDSVGKKLTLITRARKELGISNIDCIQTRSEDFAKRQKLFDTVCSRAVAETSRALCYCAPLTAPGGKILLYKSQNDPPAMPAIEKGWKTKLVDVIDYELYSTDIKRRLFVYAKQ